MSCVNVKVVVKAECILDKALCAAVPLSPSQSGDVEKDMSGTLPLYWLRQH